MIFRLIFRLDYPISYQLLDSMGKISDSIQTVFDQLGEMQKKVDLEVANRKISASCLQQDEKGLKFVVELQSMHGTFDFKNGVNTLELRKFFGVRIIHEVIERLGLESLRYFNRFGIRCLYLVEGSKFTFESINKHVLKQGEILSKSLTSCGFQQEDSMITIIGTKNINGLRVSYGPYKKNEAQIHFALYPQVEQGLMIDIDLYATNLQAQNIDFKSKLELYLTEIDNIAKSIIDNLEGELDVND